MVLSITRSHLWHDQGNESHVGNIQFWFFSICNYPFKMLHVDPNPISMGHLFAGCRDMNSSLMFKNNVKHNNLTIYHLFQSITQNQYYQHPTHSPWSCQTFLTAIVCESKLTWHTHRCTSTPFHLAVLIACVHVQSGAECVKITYLWGCELLELGLRQM